MVPLQRIDSWAAVEKKNNFDLELEDLSSSPCFAT